MGTRSGQKGDLHCRTTSAGFHRRPSDYRRAVARSRHKQETHRSDNGAWLRAAVLGADDGIVSTAALMVGMVAATADSGAILSAGLAGLVGGALSMAAGEYVSVSSERDAQMADLDKEKAELEQFPEAELRELTEIYVDRGLSPELAHDVATELHANDPLEAHVRDELGIDPEQLSQPVLAAGASAGAFVAGALIPWLTGVFGGNGWAITISAIVSLAVLGTLGAVVGDARRTTGAIRVVLGGGLALGIAAVIGALVGPAF